MEIQKVYCTNCIWSRVWYKLIGRDKMLSCTLRKQEDVNIENQDPPPACSNVILISK